MTQIRAGYETQEDVTPETQDARTFCQYHPQGHTDSAKRCADQVNLHRAALGWNAVGKWVAIRLSDGGSDGVAYDSKRDAVRHQSDEFLCCYVRIIGMPMEVCEAQIFMETNRRMYDAGFRMTDPGSKSGGRQILHSPRMETRRQVLDILRKARSN